jgi:hypothetical protein
LIKGEMRMKMDRISGPIVDGASELILLNHIFAAAAMALSSITLATSVLRLRRFKPPAVGDTVGS